MAEITNTDGVHNAMVTIGHQVLFLKEKIAIRFAEALMPDAIMVETGVRYFDMNPAPIPPSPVPEDRAGRVAIHIDRDQSVVISGISASEVRRLDSISKSDDYGMPSKADANEALKTTVLSSLSSKAQAKFEAIRRETGLYRLAVIERLLVASDTSPLGLRKLFPDLFKAVEAKDSTSSGSSSTPRVDKVEWSQTRQGVVDIKPVEWKPGMFVVFGDWITYSGRIWRAKRPHETGPVFDENMFDLVPGWTVTWADQDAKKPAISLFEAAAEMIRTPSLAAIRIDGSDDLTRREDVAKLLCGFLKAPPKQPELRKVTIQLFGENFSFLADDAVADALIGKMKAAHQADNDVLEAERKLSDARKRSSRAVGGICVESAKDDLTATRVS